jgi:hypothetical protein
MLWILAEHPDYSFSPDDLAFVTHLFDRRSNFHDILFPAGPALILPGM